MKLVLSCHFISQFLPAPTWTFLHMHTQLEVIRIDLHGSFCVEVVLIVIWSITSPKGVMKKSGTPTQLHYCWDTLVL